VLCIFLSSCYIQEVKCKFPILSLFFVFICLYVHLILSMYMIVLLYKETVFIFLHSQSLDKH